MKNIDEHYPDKQNHIVKLKQELTRVEDQLALETKEKVRLESKFASLERQFNAVKQTEIWRLLMTLKKTNRYLKNTAAYMLGRRNPKQLYSKSYKRKDAENQLKKYKFKLYELGFIEKALTDLEQLYENTHNRYLKRAVAWELVLWHANKYTKLGARQALMYIHDAMDGETDYRLLKKIAIIKAECHTLLNEKEKGKHLIQELLRIQHDPNLYLAAANMEDKLEMRLRWINRALSMYGIRPVTFSTKEEGSAYDSIRTLPLDEKVNDGPKVSVIIPTYNAGTGISLAIESIQNQTWKNLELIIVDDCSTDDTIEIINKYMEHDCRIKLISTSENSGPYVARNIGLQNSSGCFITVNDADDWSHAEKIETQAVHLMNHKEVVANTSEQVRLTENIIFYRRGTPGKYIFSNMSSLMFRREPVLNKLGYWDSVRFAADGEFKRRMIRQFGKESIVDLETGPLSFPRQSSSSLTANSEFGYHGFFMGARKEYVESFSLYHEQANSLYYPFPQNKRMFPVPVPMLPKTNDKQSAYRHFDVVIISDFRLSNPSTDQEIKLHKKLGIRTGLIQMANYNVSFPKKKIQTGIRELIDGEKVQMLVYGESITCEVLIIKHTGVLQEKQRYIPDVNAMSVRVVLDEPPILKHDKIRTTQYNLRRCANRVIEYFGKRGIWYPINRKLNDLLQKHHKKELKRIKLANENWENDKGIDSHTYINRLNDWIVNNPPVAEKGDDYN